jgi:hypothetical protein
MPRSHRLKSLGIGKRITYDPIYLVVAGADAWTKPRMRSGGILKSCHCRADDVRGESAPATVHGGDPFAGRISDKQGCAVRNANRKHNTRPGGY